MSRWELKDWNFDIDRYLNPYIPKTRIARLPKPVSRFLGHRNSPKKEVGNLCIAVWAFLGAFVGVIVIEAFFMIPTIRDHGVPILITSFGAAAILEYNAIESPLAQPRNTIVGHFLAALVGVSVTKLFALDPDFENLRWLAGALACGLASALMTLTNTVYPPAGATALMAAVDPKVERLGWYLLPLVCLSVALTLLISLLINNVQRQYPLYWWTPADLRLAQTTDDVEKTEKTQSSSQISLSKEVPPRGDTKEVSITVSPHGLAIPENFKLNHGEKAILENFKNRLREGPPECPQLGTDDADDPGHAGLPIAQLTESSSQSRARP